MAEKREITYVNIFLASSIDELHEDRLAIGDYVRKLNDIYMERGVYFRLFMCEDESLAMADGRKQAEYNEDIRVSQLFFIIFFNRAGEYTLEEFEVALEQFRATGSPAIVTCFRQGEGYNPEKSVTDFMERLDKELGHYFKVYDHIDSLKLSLLMQVKLMDLDVPVEFRDGRAYAGGQEVLTLENLPAFVKNVDFQRLRAEYEASEAEFQAAKVRYLADPTGDDGFIAAGEKRSKAQKALRELEENLFRLLLDAEERGAKDKLTPRQREAYRLLEQGKSREASAMLDMEEILADAAHEEALGQQVKERLERRVDELLQKVKIEKTLVDKTGRFKRIEQIYESAVALEERNHLKMRAMLEYCVYLNHFLLNKSIHERAIDLCKRYKMYMELTRDETAISDACNLLGIAYSHAGCLHEAEVEYLRAKEIREKLAKENPTAFSSRLADSYYLLSVLYSDTPDSLDKEEEALLQVKKMYEELAKGNPEVFLPKLADACASLGLTYASTSCLIGEESEIEFLRAKGEVEFQNAKEIYEKLAEENPEVFLPKLADICTKLGMMYRISGLRDKARAENRRAREIRAKLAEEKEGIEEDPHRAEEDAKLMKELCARIAKVFPNLYED